MGDGADKGLVSPADLGLFLEEETKLAAEFDLPLTVAVIRREGGWDGETVRLVLGVLRLADLTALLSPEELVSFFANTGFEGARAIERRVGGVLPEAVFGFAHYLPGDRAPDLISRAREEAKERRG